MSARAAVIDTEANDFDKQLQANRAYAGLRQVATGRRRRRPRHFPPWYTGARVQRIAQVDTRSWGDRIFDSGILDGYDGHGRSGTVTLPGVLTRAAIDPIMLADLPPAYVPHHIVEVTGPSQLFPLLGLVSTETVSVNSVDFITWEPNPVPPAAVVPEGALKPAMDVIANVVTQDPRHVRRVEGRDPAGAGGLPAHPGHRGGKAPHVARWHPLSAPRSPRFSTRPGPRPATVPATCRPRSGSPSASSRRRATTRTRSRSTRTTGRPSTCRRWACSTRAGRGA